jgi:cytochrome c-type biogenesis protein
LPRVIRARHDEDHTAVCRRPRQQDWLCDILARMEALAATFLLGLGSAASPCLLPLYPGFIAYLAGTQGTAECRRGRVSALLGLAVLAGLLTTMIAVGILVSVVALPFGDVLRWSVPIVTAILIVIGVALLAGKNPFARLAGVTAPGVRNPLAQAYVYGLVLGPMAMPCAGPFLVALLAISVGLADGVARVGSFIVYGLGFGLPLVLLAIIGTARGDALARTVARHHEAVLRISGLLIIATAAYELVAAGVL